MGLDDNAAYNGDKSLQNKERPIPFLFMATMDTVYGHLSYS